MNYISSNILFETKQFETIYETIPRPVVVADHLLTPQNIGSLIRLSDNLGASEVFFLEKEANHSMSRIKRTAASSFRNIRWQFTEIEQLREIIPASKTIVALETSKNATNLFETKLPEDVAFVVGNERYGMRQNTLDQADQVVYIPVPGATRSLNVTHAAAVLFFEWLRQMTIQRS